MDLSSQLQCLAQDFSKANLNDTKIFSINTNFTQDLKAFDCEDDEVIFSKYGRIEKNETYGRYVVATRKIEANEIILEEFPLVVGPLKYNNFLIFCLSCYKMVDDSQKCKKCKWPVCLDENCQKSPLHARECQIFTEQNLSTNSIQKDLEAITVLRCLLISESNEKAWDKILQFESHVDKRRNCPKVNEEVRSIIDFIRNKCALDKFSEELVEKVAGILAVNSFDALTVLKKPSTLLFEKTSLLAHDCNPNLKAKLKFDPAFPNLFKMKIISTREIKEGEMMSIHYHAVNYAENVKKRRERLKNQFYFECACKLCTLELEANNKIIDSDYD